MPKAKRNKSIRHKQKRILKKKRMLKVKKRK
jgi:hypothetical protein